MSGLCKWIHSSAWIEWLPAEQLVEGSNPSGSVFIFIRIRKVYSSACFKQHDQDRTIYYQDFYQDRRMKPSEPHPDPIEWHCNEHPNATVAKICYILFTSLV